MSKNQFYHKSSGLKPGRGHSKTTRYCDPKTKEVVEVNNEEVVQRIVSLKLDPDHANHYRLIALGLCILGFFINHKKVYRLMFEYLLLEEPRRRLGREFAKYRRVAPTRALQVLEMDIKYVWVYEKNKFAFILSVIDTFTRYVLHWTVGYTMKSAQVKAVWEYIIAQYLQDKRLEVGPIEIEVRNDNGKQFNNQLIIDFFKENEMTQVFTHAYTPEENGHIESFHKTLGKAIKDDVFTSLAMLENRLSRFYTIYNNSRNHGSIKGLPPALFWTLQEQDLIEVKVSEKRLVTYKLKVAYQDILTLPQIDKYLYRANRA
jgi:transposase InsO family protein